MSILFFAPSPAALRRVLTVLVLAALAAGAWVASLHRMDGAEMGSRFDVGSFGFFVVLWVLMMAAMMFPSVWPAVTAYGFVASHRPRPCGAALGSGRTGAFVAGYLAAWTAFGVAAFGVLALVRTTGLDAAGGDDLARWVVAPVALVAAGYQVVPAKRVCLEHCRGPLSFFHRHWRDGPAGAVGMGVRHGAFCVGCCWLLMAVLLAIGVMSVTWMVVAAVAIAVEKLAPASLHRAGSGLLTASLVSLAVVALVRPDWLPGGGMGATGAMTRG